MSERKEIQKINYVLMTLHDRKWIIPGQKTVFKSFKRSDVNFSLYLKDYMDFRVKNAVSIHVFFPPISPYFQPWDDAQSDVTPLWHDLLLSSKSKKLQMVSVVHPGYHADKNRTAADGIIYILVNVLGSLTLYRGIHGVSNFLLQTPISFSVTLRQTGCSSLTRCGSFIFQYVCDKKIGLWRGFRAIFGKKLGERISCLK